MKWIWFVCAAGLVVSCGVVGPPIPPENVGVAPTVERQKKQDELEAKRAAEGAATDPALQDQDVNLPPLRPVGTR
jgi:hypothetical protein